MTEKRKKCSPGKRLFISGSILIVLAIALFLFTISQHTLFSSSKGAFSDAAVIVNGEEISLDEIRTIYATYPQAAVKEVVLNAVITDIVNYRLLLQDARTQGFTVSPEEVDTAFANFLAQQKLSEDEFVTSLEGTGSTLDDYKLRIQEDLLVNKVMSGLDSAVSEVEVNNYYQENIAKYLIPEEVVVRQITLSPEYSDEELTQVANTIFNELQTSDFCDVAKRYSLDKTCNSYGITQEDAFPAYVSAAYNQEIGAITLVQGEDGYYFVQTLNKLNFNPIPLTQVKDSISAQLGDQKFQTAYAAYIDSLRADAVIVNTLQ